MRVQPATARYTVEESDSILRITIHPRHRIWLAVYIAAVFCVWCSLGAMSLYELIAKPSHALIFVPFISLMLLVGVAGGVYAIAWELAGIESITVTRDTLLSSRSLGSFVRIRGYALAHTDHFHLPLEHGAWWAELSARRGPSGMIRFNYHGRRRRFGLGLKVPEAQAILALIEPRVARAQRGSEPTKIRGNL